MTIDLSKYPRCVALAKSRWIKIEGISEYWIATNLADCFTNKDLIAAGINFDSKDGADILTKMEGILERRSAPKRSDTNYFKSQAYHRSKWRGLR